MPMQAQSPAHCYSCSVFHRRKDSRLSMALNCALIALAHEAPTYAQMSASTLPGTSANSAPLTRLGDSSAHAETVPPLKGGTADATVRGSESSLDAQQSPLAAARPIISRVDAVAQISINERKLVLAALESNCRQGQLDSCFVALDLEFMLALSWSDTKPADISDANRHARSFLELCKQQNRAACEKLGYLASLYDDEEYAEVYSLRRGHGLERTLREALSADPRYRDNADTLALQVAKQELFKMSPNELARLATACREGSPGACMIGARSMWTSSNPQGGSPDTGRPQDAASAKELMRLCARYASVCAIATWDEYSSSGNTERYEAQIGKLCAAQDAEACRMLAIRVSYSNDVKATQAAYTKACHLGSARACENLIEPLLDLGDSGGALTYALAACHPTNESGCVDLLKKFQPSELGTLTTHDLVDYACSKGYRRACHQLGIEAYRGGKIQEARERFGSMCVYEQDLRACRFAAQIDWGHGSQPRAKALLERGCRRHKQVDTCLDLASVYQANEERAEATRLLKDWCRRAKTGSALGLGPDDPQACRLLRRFQSGWQPATVSEIFSDPIDGSEYVGAP